MCLTQITDLPGVMQFEIYAFSKPATVLAHLMYPIVKYYQHKFRHSSIAAMKLLAK